MRRLTSLARPRPTYRPPLRPFTSGPRREDVPNLQDVGESLNGPEQEMPAVEPLQTPTVEPGVTGRNWFQSLFPVGSMFNPHLYPSEVPQDHPSRYEGPAYRADARPPEAIAADGFQGQTKPYAQPEDFHNFRSHEQRNTGSLVSTSKSEEGAESFARMKEDLVDASIPYKYEMDLDKESSFEFSQLGRNRFPEQEEVASTGVPPEQVTRVQTRHDGQWRGLDGLAFMMPDFGATEPTYYPPPEYEHLSKNGEKPKKF